MIELEIRLTKKQSRAWDILENTLNREILFDGGVRAGKTFVIVLYLLTFMLRVRGARILVGRRYFEHCRKSLYLQTIEPLLSKFPSSLFAVNKQDWIIKATNTGSQMWLVGFDDSRKVNQIMGQEYLIAYLNECTEIEQQMVEKIRTRLAQKVERPGGLGKKRFWPPRMIFDCNPTVPEFYINKWFENAPENCTSRRTRGGRARLRWTLYDNRENLTDDFIEHLENTLSEEEKRRLIYGEWVGTGDYVYKNISEDCLVDSYDLKDFDMLVAGIDWGYISAFSLWGVKEEPLEATCILSVETKGKITSEFLEEVKQKVEELGLQISDFPVYCDHEADRIEEARRMGFDAKKAYKAVAAGDSTVNRFKIKIHKSCYPVYRSMRFLQNQKDAQGNPIEGKHLKIDDHSADSARYALHSWWMDYRGSEDLIRFL